MGRNPCENASCEFSVTCSLSFPGSFATCYRSGICVFWVLYFLRNYLCQLSQTTMFISQVQSSSSKSQSSISYRICGAFKTPSQILALLGLANLFFKKKNQLLRFYSTFWWDFSQCRASYAILVERSFEDEAVIFDWRSSLQVLTSHALVKL